MNNLKLLTHYCYNDEKFLKILKTTKNPYGDGGASKQIIDIIKDIKLENILKKIFFDMKV